MAHGGEEIALHSTGEFLGLPQRLSGPLPFGDVTGDAEGADDLALFVIQRQFAGGHPGLMAVGPSLFFFLVQEWLPGPHYPLFIGLRFLGMLIGENVSICFTERVGRIV